VQNVKTNREPQTNVEPKIAAEPDSTFYHGHQLPLLFRQRNIISALPSNKGAGYRHLLPMGAVANPLVSFDYEPGEKTIRAAL
jgi:hypothetical protein